jgi:integrase
LKLPEGISKTKAGKFKARYHLGFDTTSKRRIDPCETFESLPDAIEWLTKEKAKKITGQNFAGDNKLTLAEFVDEFLIMVKPTIRANTYDVWSSLLRTHVKNNELGKVKLAQLRPINFELWQAERLGELAPSSVRTLRQVIDAVLVKARSARGMRHNPLESVVWPKASRAERHILSAEQARHFIKTCEEFDRDQAIEYGLLFQLALKTGMRPEEYQGLKWQDLELRADGGQVKVQRVIQQRPGGGWIWQQPKTERGKRKINFDAVLSKELKQHKRGQLERKFEFGPSWQELELVFPDSDGAPLSQDRLADRFHRVCKRAQLPRMTLYALRHSFVTLSLIAGVDPATISYEAGHTSVAFTLDHYGHVLEEMKQESGIKRAALFAAI